MFADVVEVDGVGVDEICFLRSGYLEMWSDHNELMYDGNQMYLTESSARAWSRSSLSDFFSLPFFPDGLVCPLTIGGTGDEESLAMGPEICSKSTAADAFVFLFFFFDCTINIRIFDRRCYSNLFAFLAFVGRDGPSSTLSGSSSSSAAVKSWIHHIDQV